MFFKLVKWIWIKNDPLSFPYCLEIIEKNLYISSANGKIFSLSLDTYELKEEYDFDNMYISGFVFINGRWFIYSDFVYEIILK
jgi:hypothetical protein